MKFINVTGGVLFLMFATAAWGQQSCTINATPVSFGGYDSYTQLDATGSVNVTCSPGAPYMVRIDAGANSGGSFTPRKALHAGGSATMHYNLYRDSSRTEVWGDGTNHTFVQSGAGTGAQDRLIIYGRLPAQQKIPVGVYSDALTVTVEW